MKNGKVMRIILSLKNLISYITVDLWRIRLKDETPRRSFWLRQLRIIVLSMREFNRDRCSLHASALTFYTLISVVPILAMAFGVAICLQTTVHADELTPVAGLKPDQRPAGAPVVTQENKDAAWYRKALTGLEPPYPTSFRFLEDQGNWYTPFTRAGMTGPYDIRNWHRTTAK